MFVKKNIYKIGCAAHNRSQTTNCKIFYEAIFSYILFDRTHNFSVVRVQMAKNKNKIAHTNDGAADGWRLSWTFKVMFKKKKIKNHTSFYLWIITHIWSGHMKDIVADDESTLFLSVTMGETNS